MGNKQSGFTIVEVMIFLAVSGLLLAMAIISVGGTVNSSRFNDSVEATVSQLQLTYDNVLVGRNERSQQLDCDAGGPSSVGASGCTLLGRVIRFQSGSAITNTYYLVGANDEIERVDTSRPVTTQLYNIAPLVLDNSSVHANLIDTSEIAWGTVYNDTLCSGSNDCYLWIVMTRAPKGEQMLTYNYRTINDGDFDPDDAFRPANLFRGYNLCLREAGGGGGRGATIELGNAATGRDFKRIETSTCA